MTSRRLLILDDDPLIGGTIENIARSQGFESTVTLRAEEFFSVLERWEPSHIALDLIMPGMDGVEVMVELARRDCRAQIIITSGVGSRVLDAAARSAAEHGLPIAGVLAKPFSPARLRQLLRDTTPPSDRARPSDATATTAKRSAEITVEELEKAIDADQLFLVYQPKVDCSSRRLAGFEALVRWRDPARGSVAPSLFVPLAEEHGLIAKLSRRVIEQALAWFGDRLNPLVDGRLSSVEAGRAPDLTLSINLSAKALDDSQFVEDIDALCRQHRLAPQRIIFELTETAAMEDPVASLDMLTRLRMKGFQLSIDDFGTGYSSMLQLVRLPFSEVKIDQSFVLSAGDSEESRAVIRSILELGRSLGLQTTAEGVEDEATLDYLRQLGCEFAQGFLLSVPLECDDAIDWARSAFSQAEPPRSSPTAGHP